MCVDIYVYMPIHIHACTHIFMYASLYIYVYVYIHIYIYIYSKKFILNASLPTPLTSPQTLYTGGGCCTSGDTECTGSDNRICSTVELLQ